MKAAILSSFLGIFLSLLSGSELLHIGWLSILLCVLISNFAMWLALLATLRIEKFNWFKRIRIHGAIKAWTCASLLYLATLLSLAPPLREEQNLIVLFLPLILSGGFGILAFGPVQDYLVRRQQRQ